MSAREEGQEGLIAEIVKTLKVSPERRNECLDTIYFLLQGAPFQQRLYSKPLPPAALKANATALSRALKRARTLSQKIEQPLSVALDDCAIDGDGALDYPRWRRWLDQSIAAAESLISTTTTVRNTGNKPRDVNKWLARSIAAYLVASFSPRAGKRSATNAVVTDAIAVDADATGERSAIDAVASFIYEILTGERSADILEPPHAYKPPTIRTWPRPRGNPETVDFRSIALPTRPLPPEVIEALRSSLERPAITKFIRGRLGREPTDAELWAGWAEARRIIKKQPTSRK